MTRRPLQQFQISLVARKFYLEQKTKSQIAKELGISRFKVARLLNAALEEGIVIIAIHDQDEINTMLAEQVRQAYGLNTVLVLDGPDMPTASLVKPLGRLVADYLNEILSDGQLLGVAWGRTLVAAAEALTHLPKVDVVQVGGSPIELDLSQNPTQLVHLFAQMSGGTPYPLFGPMWVVDSDLKNRLLHEPAVAKAMSRYDEIDVLALGIGSWKPAASCLCFGFPDDWREEALRHHVQADLCATLIDHHGAVVTSRLDETGLCLSTEQLRKVPERIGIGGGVEKLEAVRAVLKGKWLTTLITDATVARGLLHNASY